MNYDGWCRRIDLSFRTRFPFFQTRLFKVDEYKFQLYVENEIDDFDHYEKIFDNEIRYITTPIKLVKMIPSSYEAEIKCISDEDIPSNFEGIPFTLDQLMIYIASVHRDAKISKIQEKHSTRQLLIELVNNIEPEAVKRIEETANALKFPYTFQVSAAGSEASRIEVKNEVFNIAPSQTRVSLSCGFIERDEALWYENINGIYDGTYKKSDLYFIDQSKTCCLVNFSKFQNANLRNHLLLYDVVYCVLPLAADMKGFLQHQKIQKNEIMDLARRGRIKIINIQPEVRLDYGFLNEVYQENPSSIASRRALSALCAIDLVELNQSYIFSDPELEKINYPLLKEFAEFTNSNVETVSSFLLWPKTALRASLDALNQSGPMGIARYGINNPIINSWPSKDKEIYEFEFVVNSDQIHLAHALDATYFPFFIDGDKYSDHPYALMMGVFLNFYKRANYKDIGESFDFKEMKKIKNPSLSMISTFDINDYIPLLEFEEEVSSRVVRSGMNSLFSELSQLDVQGRNKRISIYNLEVEKTLKNKKVVKHALDLGEEAAGLVVPFVSTGKKLITKGAGKAKSKFPVMQEVSDYIQDKTMSKNMEKRQVSLLSKINRVARLKREFS
ncbi:hypothetical protein [Vreelandella sp.]|uniref:hypothetical protein n=1 Tax=Vreelandella sp. TaxID=3137778 RepID=UPI003BAADEF5